jgi:transposase
MPQPNDPGLRRWQALSRSLVALDHNSTIIAIVEMSQSSWLVGGVLPGIERQPRKKLEPSPERLLAVLHRWRDEAVKVGRTITRIALAFEAGRDGFWLARSRAVRGVEAHVIHPSSVAVSREERRAKTDLARHRIAQSRVLGWLRSENGAIAAWCAYRRLPGDAKRPNRERECLVKERTRLVNRMKGTLARLGIRNFRQPCARRRARIPNATHVPQSAFRSGQLCYTVCKSGARSWNDANSAILIYWSRSSVSAATACRAPMGRPTIRSQSPLFCIS